MTLVDRQQVVAVAPTPECTVKEYCLDFLCQFDPPTRDNRHLQVMTVVDRQSDEAVAPTPECIVKEYWLDFLCQFDSPIRNNRDLQVMTVVDRQQVEAVAPTPECIVKEYSLPSASASIQAALGASNCCSNIVTGLSFLPA